jgi:hypothetical protein
MLNYFFDSAKLLEVGCSSESAVHHMTTFLVRTVDTFSYEVEISDSPDTPLCIEFPVLDEMFDIPLCYEEDGFIIPVSDYVFCKEIVDTTIFYAKSHVKISSRLLFSDFDGHSSLVPEGDVIFESDPLRLYSSEEIDNLF